MGLESSIKSSSSFPAILQLSKLKLRKGKSNAGSSGARTRTWVPDLTSGSFCCTGLRPYPTNLQDTKVGTQPPHLDARSQEHHSHHMASTVHRLRDGSRSCLRIFGLLCLCTQPAKLVLSGRTLQRFCQNHTAVCMLEVQE
jgi:hypothetical protein